jgi:hypothetical protein
VPDIRMGDITGAPGPALYVSLAESPARDVTLVARTSADPAVLFAQVQTAVAEVDRLVPVRSVGTMADVVRAAYATSWVMMGLLLVLAALTTGLGVIGIYAVLAHHVALSRREIGVRMALGAQPRVVIGDVVRSGLLLAGLGILIGSGAAALSTRLLESLLFGVSALSPGRLPKVLRAFEGRSDVEREPFPDLATHRRVSAGLPADTRLPRGLGPGRPFPHAWAARRRLDDPLFDAHPS